MRIFQIEIIPVDFLHISNTSSPNWNKINSKYIHNFYLMQAFSNKKRLIFKLDDFLRLQFHDFYVTPAIRRRTKNQTIQYINNIVDIDDYTSKLITPYSTSYEAFMIEINRFKKPEYIYLQEDEGLCKIKYNELQIEGIELKPIHSKKINTPFSLIDISSYDEIYDGHIITMEPTPISLYLVGKIPHIITKSNKITYNIAIPNKLREVFEIMYEKLHQNIECY